MLEIFEHFFYFYKKFFMKNKIFYFILIFVILCINNNFAQEVNQHTLQKIALNFYKSNNPNLKQNDIKISSINYYKSSNNTPIYNIYNFEPKGFIIVAAQKNVFPILGYSFENNFEKNSNNSNFKYWMDNYTNQINIAINTSKPITKDINEAWEYFQNINQIKSKAVTPLLTSTWNQDKYYNEQCPADAAGPDGHTYAGCVATAMGQIMFYHRWPLSGFGNYTYNHPTYGTITADFQNANYQWNDMINKLTNSNIEIAKLLFHIGVSVDMDYGPTGSGMWNHKAAYSFKNYFKYCNETRYIFRDSSSLNWDSLIITNLDKKRPLYYAGWEDTTFTSGHAFVCDGYQSNIFFHFNWGWNGSNDGFYYLDQLNPNGYNFNFCQELIVDIYPDTLNYTYPLNCTSFSLDTNNYGTFTDGSGNLQYSKGNNCSWLINPNCGEKIKLLFDRFDIASGDTINIYDGTNEQSPLLACYNNLNLPITTESSSPTINQSSTNNMYITFSTDSINEADGFNASYSLNYCLADSIFDLSGSVSDGSGSCDYNNSTNCRWIIKPANAQSITLNFTEFNLASDNTGDYLKVFKNNFLASNTIATYNNLTPPTQSLIVQAPVVCIRFITNSTTQAPGWTLNYATNTTNILENEFEQNKAFIYPNPFVTDATISFNSEIEQNVIISVIDVSGKIIINSNIKSIKGTNKIKLSDLLLNINEGYYIVNIKLNNIEYSKKLICLPN